MQKMVHMKATQSATSRTQRLMLPGAQAEAWNGACQGNETPPPVRRPVPVRLPTDAALRRIFHGPKPSVQPPPRSSSVRSAIFIVQASRAAQAPPACRRPGAGRSGAARQGGIVRNAEMPLPTELRRGALGPHSYKYAAPNGTVTRASRCEIPRLTPAVLTSFNQLSPLAPLRRLRTPHSAFRTARGPVLRARIGLGAGDKFGREERAPRLRAGCVREGTV